jgi:hypothetical protein
MEENSNQDQTNDAIQKLWSADEAERIGGKQLLLERGSQAIQPLVTLLKDLIENEHPRFVLGREEEGSKLLADYLSLCRNGEKFDKISEAYDRILYLAINARLMADLIELLGDLRAEEAVPVFIEIMERRRIHKPTDSFGIEMIGLVRIGSPAVPSLLRAIDQAQEKAALFNDINTFKGFVIEADPTDDELEDIEDADQQDLAAELEEEDKIDIRNRASRIQLRAASVLGEIGDRRALPQLRKLLSATEQEYFIDSIQRAIDKIEGRGRLEDEGLPRIKAQKPPAELRLRENKDFLTKILNEE